MGLGAGSRVGTGMSAAELLHGPLSFYEGTHASVRAGLAAMPPAQLTRAPRSPEHRARSGNNGGHDARACRGPRAARAAPGRSDGFGTVWDDNSWKVRVLEESPANR